MQHSDLRSATRPSSGRLPDGLALRPEAAAALARHAAGQPDRAELLVGIARFLARLEAAEAVGVAHVETACRVAEENELEAGAPVEELGFVADPVFRLPPARPAPPAPHATRRWPAVAAAMVGLAALGLSVRFMLPEPDVAPAPAPTAAAPVAPPAAAPADPKLGEIQFAAATPLAPSLAPPVPVALASATMDVAATQPAAIQLPAVGLAKPPAVAPTEPAAVDPAKPPAALRPQRMLFAAAALLAPSSDPAPASAPALAGGRAAMPKPDALPSAIPLVPPPELAAAPVPVVPPVPQAANPADALPSTVALHVVVNYPHRDPVAQRGLQLVRTLRSLGYVVVDSEPEPHVGRQPAIDYFFAEDQQAAGALARQLTGFEPPRWRAVPARGVLPRPGTIHITLPGAESAAHH